MLTILGLAAAVVAFGVIRTLIDSYYAGADVLPPDRLVTRNAVSIIFYVPLAYKEKIEKVPGVESVSYGNWFGGLYKNDPKNFFPNYTVGPGFIDLYREYIFEPEQREQFLKEKNSAIAGQRLANRFGWKVGDPIRLTGQIYPGEWDFVLRAIYKGRETGVDENSLMFRWDYFDDRLRQTTPEMAKNGVGWYVVKIADPQQAPVISTEIDALFKNSAAETLTETEKSFTLGFLAQMDAIIVGMRIISYLIIGVILLVLVNTMAMSARERISEYALLKTLGFGPSHLIGLILGESMAVAVFGGLLGILLMFPVIGAASQFLQNFFSGFEVNALTILLAMTFVLIVGITASLFPIYKAVRLPIIQGLRNVG